MKIIICDDTPADSGSLRSLVNRFFQEQYCPVQISVYEDGESFLGDFNKNKNADIAFLDIYMPGINGVDVARKIRETDNDMVIVFTTTSLEHGVDGYSVDAFQYLVKPIEYPKVESVLNKCVKQFADSLRFVEVLSDRMTVRVLLKDILFIEVFGNDCLIHTPAMTIKSRITLDELQKQLDGKVFLRTHRSYVVNMRYIQNIAENDFMLTNGVLVPIRRSDKLAVKQAYMDYLFALRRGNEDG